MFKDDFITVARAHHLALKSQRSYWFQARKFIGWTKAKSANDLLESPTEKIRKYLSEMANHGEESEGDEGVSASTQNSAFHALRFLYEKVLGVSLGDLSKIPRATGHRRIVDVPEPEIAANLVKSIPGKNGLAIRLIFGTAGRLNDIIRLRVKDLNFSKRLIYIQQSKGGTSRLVPMPESLMEELKLLVKEREIVHKNDIANGQGWVHMPGKLAEKYPKEQTSIGYQYVFASSATSIDPNTGKIGRHHIFDVTLQRAFADARRRLKIKRHYTIHGLRHCAAQWWEASGVERSTIQKLLGHKNSSTTDIYLLSGKKSVASIPCPI